MNEMILGTLNRDILFISIVLAVILVILTYVIGQYMSGLDTKVPNMINPTTEATGSGVNPIAQNIEASSASESKNAERVASAPIKCLGSALCPD
jgi:hypothetical protein